MDSYDNDLLLLLLDDDLFEVEEVVNNVCFLQPESDCSQR